ncbi:hypothetical protein ABAC460_23085 [Asticcacaulis sp. AC460]|uniref:hypothetical protein n=1 Tax=Asticcacaulis sp. AC460 TaxID=1282360 RepID=UPI0003C4038E|nr:hypothetical protein [Asticcacaulis sp. AC460]ESQ86599.1 hypothetical protein ABAC460_23085 [Asticcacaulis sp. AC460]
MADLVWPCGLFHCPDPVVTLIGNSQSGGIAIDGARSQTVDTSAGGSWRIQIDALLKSKESVLAAEAWLALIGSGVPSLILPLRQARSQVGGGDPARTFETSAFPARVTFDPADYTQAISLAVNSAAANRQTTIVLDCAGTIRAGKFSLHHGDRWRIYELVVKGATSGTDQTFEIRPPLRGAVAEGATAYMSYCFLHVHAEPGSFQIDYDGLSKATGRLQVTFVEARP